MKISKTTIEAYGMLTEDAKAKVDGIVKRHKEACRKNGFTPDNLERVYIEAIESVEKDGGEYNKDTLIQKEIYFSRTTYGVYTSDREIVDGVGTKVGERKKRGAQ